jgi:hypothetical protein
VVDLPPVDLRRLIACPPSPTEPVEVQYGESLVEERMAKEPSVASAAATTPAPACGLKINEDWAATFVGLVLVVLVLVGVIVKGMVP